MDISLFVESFLCLQQYNLFSDGGNLVTIASLIPACVGNVWLKILFSIYFKYPYMAFGLGYLTVFIVTEPWGGIAGLLFNFKTRELRQR